MAQPRGRGTSRLVPAVQISSLSLHMLVFSTLGLNVRWGVCVRVVAVQVCVHVCVCLSPWLLWTRLLGTLEGGLLPLARLS